MLACLSSGDHGTRSESRRVRSIDVGRSCHGCPHIQTLRILRALLHGNSCLPARSVSGLLPLLGILPLGGAAGKSKLSDRGTLWCLARLSLWGPSFGLTENG